MSATTPAGEVSATVSELCAEWHAIEARLNAEDLGDDDRYQLPDAVKPRRVEIRREIAATPCADLADLLALVRLVEFDVEQGPWSKHGAFAGITAKTINRLKVDLPRLVVRTPTTTGDDDLPALWRRHVELAAQAAAAEAADEDDLAEIADAKLIVLDQQIVDTTAASMGGLATKALLAKQSWSKTDGSPPEDFNEALGLSIVADIERLAKVVTVADPALALVETWWARHREVTAVERGSSGFAVGTPENEARDAVMDTAVERRGAILDQNIAAPPRTAAGVAAVAEIAEVSLRLNSAAETDWTTQGNDYERLLVGVMRANHRHTDDGTEIKTD